MKLIKTMLIKTSIKKDMQLLQDFALDAQITHSIDFYSDKIWSIAFFIHDLNISNFAGIEISEKEMFLNTMLKDCYIGIRNVLINALFDN